MLVILKVWFVDSLITNKMSPVGEGNKVDEELQTFVQKRSSQPVEITEEEKDRKIEIKKERNRIQFISTQQWENEVKSRRIYNNDNFQAKRVVTKKTRKRRNMY